jgi:hypothetical protein
MINFLKRSSLLFMFIYLPFQSSAWGMLGHRIVGEIAESYLSSKTKKEIAKILGNESIAMASNWADFIKSDPAYNYVSPWHYINFRSGLTHAEMMAYLEKDTATDAWTKLNFLVAELKKKDLPQDKKVMFLKLLIHIAGDVHQPMHTARPEDRGGNNIKVQWFGESTNLHHVWDDELISYQRLSYTEYAKVINHTTRQQVKEWQKQPMSQWFYDSYQICEKIYSNVKPDDKLGYRYNFDYADTVNQQLLKGGVHLAGLLNEIFG